MLRGRKSIAVRCIYYWLERIQPHEPCGYVKCGIPPAMPLLLYNFLFNSWLAKLFCICHSRMFYLCEKWISLLVLLLPFGLYFFFFTKFLHGLFWANTAFFYLADFALPVYIGYSFKWTMLPIYIAFTLWFLRF